MLLLKVTEYENIDPEEVFVKLLNKADHWVAMSTTLHPSFYNRLRIKQAFVTAFNKVDNFRLLLDYNTNWKKREEQIPWLAELEPEIKLDVRKSTSPLLHWIMVDARHFRLEKPHKLDEQKEIVLTSNLLIQDAIKPVSDKIQDFFSSWWKDAIIVK